MALIHLHKIMIGTALVFCVLFTARAFAIGDVAMGGGSLALTAGLIGYFRWFMRNKARTSKE